MAPGLSLKEIIGVEEKNFLRSYPERGSCQISPRRANASVEFRSGLTIRRVLLYYAAYYCRKQMSTTTLRLFDLPLMKRRSQQIHHQPDRRLRRSPRRIAVLIHFHNIQPHQLPLARYSAQQFINFGETQPAW